MQDHVGTDDVRIATLENEVRPENYGVKSAEISSLHADGYRVPESIFISTVSNSKVFDQQWFQDRLQSKLSRFATGSNTYNIAIRSSPTCSDTFTESHAGHFDSYLGEMNFRTVIKSLKNILTSLDRECDVETCKMGFIVQERIEAKYSGVIFSSNPITGARDESVVSVERGQAGPLVSGKTAGEDIVITEADGTIQIPHYESDLNSSILESVYATANEIEDDVGYPVDIEWSVAGNSNEIHYLQCRPDTGILNHDDRVIPLTERAVDDLPVHARDNPQIQKRIEAERRGITVPEAYTVVVDCSDHSPNVPPLPDSPTGTGRETYTVMLLYPDDLSEELKETTLPERMHFEEFVERCERYCVRSYPNYNTLVDDLEEIAKMSCEEYWEAFVLVQRIYDPEYTGIIRRTTNGYLIEIGRGHLIAKGVIAASEYVITDDREVIATNEVEQERRFEIVDGYVLEAAVDGGRPKVELPKELLLRVIDDFEPLLDAVGTALEFGIRENGDNRSPYLIDAIQQESSEDTEALLPSNDVVSTGEIEGSVVEITDEQMKDDVDEYYDVSDEAAGRNFVFACDRPDISLLSLLDRFPDDSIGFVFEKGSVLSHLSVLLRERGIPAVKDVDVDELDTGERVTLVARADTDAKVHEHGRP